MGFDIITSAVISALATIGTAVSAAMFVTLPAETEFISLLALKVAFGGLALFCAGIGSGFGLSIARKVRRSALEG